MPAADNPSATGQLGRAFADPVRASQSSFRHILDAMAEPGTVHPLAADVQQPRGLAPAAAVALLTLADFETPVWLDPGIGETAAAYVRFHTGARLAGDPRDAHFAVIDGAQDVPGLAAFDPGNDRYPDRSATVIIQCRALTGGAAVTLAGPGIRGTRPVAPAGLWPRFWREVAANAERYPLGIDLLLVADRLIMGLPRSCRVVSTPETL